MASTSVSQILSSAKVIIQLIPYVIDAIKTVELMVFDDPTGKGPQKLVIVKAILSTIYSSLDEVWGPLEQIISVIVAVYNKTGEFKKSS